MHSLQTIKRTNTAAILEYCKNSEGNEHLINAPQEENFDFNIPWHFEGNVLHVHLHTATKAVDLMKLQDLVAKTVGGPHFSTKWHRYE